MCEHCSTIQVNSAKFGVYARNYNYDPTRTTALRNAFAKDLEKRFNKLAKKITQDIGQDDILNLSQGLSVNAAFGFPTSETKVADFMNWLQNQVDDGLLEIRKLNGGTVTANAAWTNLYIEDSYNRGVQRARYEMKKVGYTVPTIEESGGIQVVTGTPFHMDRVGLLYSRTYEELKGITSSMSTQLGRVLSQGMIDGKNPKEIARMMNKAMTGMGADLGITDTLGRFIPAKRRAVIMARTEMIRAHHQGMVNEMENWGVHGVSVKAEFTTAGDDRVCPTCAGLEGKIYELAESRNLIPVHPQCRCIVLPTRPDGTPQNIKKVDDEMVWNDFKKLEDAQNYLYDTYHISYTGDSLKAANKIGQTMTSIFNRSPKIRKIFSEGDYAHMSTYFENYARKDGVLGEYNLSTGAINLYGKFMSSRAADKLTLGQWHANSSGSSILRHEFGHWVRERQVKFKWTSSQESQWKQLWAKYDNLYKYEHKIYVSEYGMKNIKEFFAETFNAWTSPDYLVAKKRLPDDLEAFMNELLL